jgi:hypothetical protein
MQFWGTGIHDNLADMPIGLASQSEGSAAPNAARLDVDVTTQASPRSSRLHNHRNNVQYTYFPLTPHRLQIICILHI